MACETPCINVPTCEWDDKVPAEPEPVENCINVCGSSSGSGVTSIGTDTPDSLEIKSNADGSYTINYVGSGGTDPALVQRVDALETQVDAMNTVISDLGENLATTNNRIDGLVTLIEQERSITLYKVGSELLVSWNGTTFTFYGGAVDIEGPNFYRESQNVAGFNTTFIEGGYLCILEPKGNTPSIVVNDSITDIYATNELYIFGRMQTTNGEQSVYVNGFGNVPLSPVEV